MVCNAGLGNIRLAGRMLPARTFAMARLALTQVHLRKSLKKGRHVENGTKISKKTSSCGPLDKCLLNASHLLL